LLLDSLPSGESPLRGIAGDVPSLIEPPYGCRFHPRCPRASDACRKVRPPVQELQQGHEVRCHHPHMQAAVVA